MTDKIGVVGLGLMGRGIAACFLDRGFQVVGVVPTAEELEAAVEEIVGSFAEGGALGQPLPTNALAERAGRFQGAFAYDALDGCEFVVESVTEDFAVKVSALAGIENCVDAGVTIASNTSAIPIGRLQATCRRPERLVGMHWAEPARTTRFLELIRGEQTSDAALEHARAVGLRLGKDPVVCQRDLPGFIVNRMAYAMYREACWLVEQGVADMETVDRAFRNTIGLWAAICGPFRWIDLTGGPALYAKAMEDVLPTLSTEQGVPQLLAKLARQGLRGAPEGRGFYCYSVEEAERWREMYHRQTLDVQRLQDREFPLPAVPDGSQ